MASELEKGTITTESDDTGVHSKSGFIAAVRRLKSIPLLWARKKPQKQVHGRMAPTEIRKLENYPIGFPRLSCFLSSDDAFCIYRRFEPVYSRLLLHTQDEMSRLEAKLHAMDKTDFAEDNGNYLMSCTEDAARGPLPRGWTESRGQLLERMKKVSIDYADLLLKTKQLKALDMPSKRDYRSVLHFMENRGGQLFQEESAFIYHKADLVSLRPGRDHGWLDGKIERALQILRCRLLKETRAKTVDPDIHYYDRGRIATCTTIIITCMILALLIVPIWLLYRFSKAGTITTSPNSILVILMFTLVFCSILSAFTRASRHEIMAASAG
ncbi:MAG: hypothetical protein Q9187_006120 [Circinaria calcarea]